MTASILRVPGNGSTMSPDACQRTLAVFDGRLRYDLQLVFKRLDKVKADKGYAGPVVVCAVYFSPIAGYIPSRYAIKYIAKLREIDLAPLRALLLDAGAAAPRDGAPRGRRKRGAAPSRAGSDPGPRSVR